MNMTRQEAPLASWLDLCQCSDTSDRPTCLAGKNPRRIDWMIVSRGLQHIITGRQLRWDTGLATHAWQTIDITTGTPSQYTQWVPPEAYPEVDVTPQALSEASAAACRRYAADWIRARHSKDPDLMWQVITRAAHCMHLTVAGKTVERGASRAGAKTVPRDEYGPGPHRAGVPETLEVRRVLRAHRHLLNLRGISKHPGQQQGIAVQQLLDALRQDGKNAPR